MHGAVVRLSKCLWLLRGVADRPARHHFARVLAAEFLDCPLESIALSVDADGRPSLSAPVPLHVSLSHRPGVTLAAIWPAQVGVDVEWADARHLDVAHDLFTPAEAAWLETTAQGDAFARLWTAKEAVLKAVGQGIVQGMHQPDLSGLLQPGLVLSCTSTRLHMNGTAFHVAWRRLTAQGHPAIVAVATADDCRHGDTATSTFTPPFSEPFPGLPG